VARHQLKVYEVAARVGMHPTRLGAVLNERLPLRPDLAVRIREAVDAVASERRSR
jgi:hypothetical protein